MEGIKNVILIGIGVSGIVDITSNKIIKFEGLKILDDKNISEHFKLKYSIDTYSMGISDIEIRVNEFCRKDKSNYVFLHIGHGIGASIVINNKRYAGSNGMAGQLIGSITRNRKGDSKRGFIESEYNTFVAYEIALKYAVENKDTLIARIVPTDVIKKFDVSKMKMEFIDKAMIAGDKGLTK